MYSFDSRVRYSECDENGMLALVPMMNYLQDCSTFHCEAVGRGLSELRHDHLGWFVTSWLIEIDSLPRFCDTITTSTWCYAIKRLQAERCFEIRGADAMPEKYIAAYLALIKGIFFHSSAVQAILDEFSHIRESDLTAADHALMRGGFDAKTYGMPADKLIDRLFLLARHGLTEEENALLDPFRELVQQKKTLAETLPIPE